MLDLRFVTAIVVWVVTPCSEVVVDLKFVLVCTGCKWYFEGCFYATGMSFQLKILCLQVVSEFTFSDEWFLRYFMVMHVAFGNCKEVWRRREAFC